MKRMAITFGIALSILSCAQHDSNSPDTSGNDPQNPNRTTTTGDTSTNAGGMNTMNTDGTNNNQTGDSSLNNRQNQ